MELEEMKQLWAEMSEDLDKQKSLTDQLIVDMTKERYRNKFRGMINLESMGAAICFVAALFILVNFPKLDTWYLLASGIFSVAYLFIIPALSLRSMYRMKNLHIPQNNMKQTLLEYGQARRQFQLISQLGIILNFVLMVAIVLITLGVSGKKHLITDDQVWLYLLPFGFVFLFFFSRWGYRCYKSLTASAENLLLELESESGN